MVALDEADGSKPIRPILRWSKTDPRRKHAHSLPRIRAYTLEKAKKGNSMIHLIPSHTLLSKGDDKKSRIMEKL